MNQFASLVPDMDMAIFIDEAARDARTAGRTRGWALKGTRCRQQRVFVRGQRYSILPVLTLDRIITHDIIEGPVTLERFLKFLRDDVVRTRLFW